MLYSNMIPMDCSALCKSITIIASLGETRGREDRKKWDREWNKGYRQKRGAGRGENMAGKSTLELGTESDKGDKRAKK